jgi:hypothetical protein
MAPFSFVLALATKKQPMVFGHGLLFFGLVIYMPIESCNRKTCNMWIAQEKQVLFYLFKVFGAHHRKQ